MNIAATECDNVDAVQEYVQEYAFIQVRVVPRRHGNKLNCIWQKATDRNILPTVESHDLGALNDMPYLDYRLQVLNVPCHDCRWKINSRSIWGEHE